MEIWRKDLRDWAENCAAEYLSRPSVLGLMIGGSLARGQEWRHSDLELGLLVEEKDTALSYFNIDSGRGVEAIQLVHSELKAQVERVEAGDWQPILNWPIQLWCGKISKDPTGLLSRFKRQFDAGLFQDEVLLQKISDQRSKIAKILSEARAMIAVGRPTAALVRARTAMNELILAFHWANRELPRSQNRTDSRLRLVSRRYGAPEFYFLYRDVFDLDDSTKVIRSVWPKIRQQVLEITRLWGDAARDFFEFAVDGQFQWRQNAGILTVYRLYVPVIGGDIHGLIGQLDDPEWRANNQDLVTFLGLGEARAADVTNLIRRVEITSAEIELPGM